MKISVLISDLLLRQIIVSVLQVAMLWVIGCLGFLGCHGGLCCELCAERLFLVFAERGDELLGHLSCYVRGPV